MSDTTPPVPLAEIEKQLLAVFQSGYETSLKIIRTTFEAGKMFGKNEAAVELRAKMFQVLAPEGIPPAETSEEEDGEAKRAPRGSVRPAVIQALRSVPGMKPSEVAEKAGINENSARGMLNKLAEEGVTRKVGDKWYLLPLTPPPTPPPPPSAQ